MGGWDDDAAVQRKAQFRLLSALPTLRLQDSAERVDAAGIAHHPVPEVRQRIRRDGAPETHQHVLSAAFPPAATLGPMPSKRALPKQAASFIETMDCLPVPKLPDGPEWTYEIKLDGYRLEVVRNGRMTTLYSCRENVLNQRSPINRLPACLSLGVQSILSRPFCHVFSRGREFRESANSVHEMRLMLFLDPSAFFRTNLEALFQDCS